MDFSAYVGRCPNFGPDDAKKLSDLFASPEVSPIVRRVDTLRRRKRALLISIPVFIFSLAFFDAFFLRVVGFLESAIGWLIVLLFVRIAILGFMLPAILVSHFFKIGTWWKKAFWPERLLWNWILRPIFLFFSESNTVKEELFPGIAWTVSKNFQFQWGINKYLPKGKILDSDETLAETGAFSPRYLALRLRDLSMLKDFDHSRFEDTVTYSSEDGGGFEIAGWEVLTTRRSRSKNGSPRFVEHALIFRIRLLNAEFPNGTAVRILPNNMSLTRGDIPQSFLAFLIWVLIIAGFTWFFLAVKNSWNLWIFSIFAQQGADGLGIVVATYGFFFSIPFFIMSLAWFVRASRQKRRWNEKISIENIEFEKRFDVYGDQIDARKLITPAFAERLSLHMERTDFGNERDFAFFENTAYLKIGLSRFQEFAEHSFLPLASHDLNSYVRFYSNLKEIVSLAEDLNLAYYAKKAAALTPEGVNDAVPSAAVPTT